MSRLGRGADSDDDTPNDAEAAHTRISRTGEITVARVGRRFVVRRTDHKNIVELARSVYMRIRAFVCICGCLCRCACACMFMVAHTAAIPSRHTSRNCSCGCLNCFYTKTRDYSIHCSDVLVVSSF